MLLPLFKVEELGGHVSSAVTCGQEERPTVSVESVWCRTEGFDDLLHFVLEQKSTHDQMNIDYRGSCTRLIFVSAGQTSSSQLQPRSWVTAPSESDAGDGAVASSGMPGWCGGSFSMSFKLPWVPLLGAGFKPSKSEPEGETRGSATVLHQIQ